MFSFQKLMPYTVEGSVWRLVDIWLVRWYVYRLRKQTWGFPTYMWRRSISPQHGTFQVAEIGVLSQECLRFNGLKY